ncbi:unnamed protein product, partial [marine sediment metagenome]
LPDEGIVPPSEWPMPDPKGQYMRQSIVDLMPDPLSPLFATLGLSAINDGIDLMSKEMLNNLALVYRDAGEIDQAIAHSQTALELCRQLPGSPCRMG